MKKIILLSFTALLAFLFFACASKSQISFHTIPYSTNLKTLYDEYGSDVFNHTGDNFNSKYYVINDYYNMKSNGTLHIISNYETYQQTTEYTCGCSAALMVLNHYGNKDFNEMQIGELVKVDTEKGTSVEGLANFFKSIGYTVDYNASVNSFFDNINDFEKFVVEKIDSGVPIMVDWVDWDGHWQTIIGIDICNGSTPYDDVLIFADSYDVTDHCQDGYYIFPLGRFFDMWREGPCAKKQVPYEQPFVIAYPKENK